MRNARGFRASIVKVCLEVEESLQLGWRRMSPGWKLHRSPPVDYHGVHVVQAEKESPEEDTISSGQLVMIRQSGTPQPVSELTSPSSRPHQRLIME